VETTKTVRILRATAGPFRIGGRPLPRSGVVVVVVVRHPATAAVIN